MTSRLGKKLNWREQFLWAATVRQCWQLQRSPAGRPRWVATTRPAALSTGLHYQHFTCILFFLCRLVLFAHFDKRGTELGWVAVTPEKCAVIG